MDWKGFLIKYKWWLIAAFIGVLLIVLIIRKKMDPNTFDRGQYKTITDKQRDMLEKLHPAVKQRFFELIDKIQKKGIKVQITSTYRSFQHQQRLKEQLGSMAATPGTSPHNYGLAVDMVIYHKGKRHGNYDANKAEWEATGVPALARSLGFTWGGDFKSHPFDPVHFDLVKNLKLSTSKLLEKGLAIYGSPEKIIGNKIPLS